MHGSVDRLPAPPKDQVFDSERMVEFVRNYLKQCLADGQARGIVGRGAACAMASLPGVFNIFVYASMSRKIRWFEEHFPEQAANARQVLRPPTAGVKAHPPLLRSGVDRSPPLSHDDQLLHGL